MVSELRTFQWNIGGGKILADGHDPLRMSSYSRDGIKEILELIGNYEPDIITLQETHQPIPLHIAKTLGYGHWINHDVSPSHIEAGQRLGHGLVTNLPILQESFDKLEYPQLPEDFIDETPHDKGVSTYRLLLENDETLTTQNLHLFPFGHFGIGAQESMTIMPVFRDVEAKVGVHEGKRLLQGDFNLNASSLRPFLPGLFEAGLQEVMHEEATTPSGKHIDHVLFAGMTVVKSLVVSNVLTDHYPIVTTFAL